MRHNKNSGASLTGKKNGNGKKRIEQYEHNLEPGALWTNLGASIQRRVVETGRVWQTESPRIREVLR